ncbi:MAG: hypothetical protein Q8S33_15185 [Myxococcales bacterium]|nr:hypothetical protein [Myxococcales bacterium]
MRTPKVISNQRQYERTLRTVEKLWNSRPGSKAQDSLAMLALLLEEYEKRTFDMEDPACHPSRVLK